MEQINQIDNQTENGIPFSLNMHTPPSAVHKHLLVDVPGRGFGAFFLSFYSMKESIAIVQMIPEVARNRSNMDAWSPKSLLDVRSITCENPIGPMRMPDRPKKLLAVQSITSMNSAPKNAIYFGIYTVI